MEKPKVGEILVRAGLIDEMQLRAALGDQNNWGQRLGATLVKMGLVSERDLVRALAQQLQLPVVELEGKRVQPEVLELVPVEFAEKHMCVPLFVKENGGARTLYVGMEDPSDLAALDDLGFRTGLEVSPVLVSPSELFEAMDRFYHRGQERAIGLPDEVEADPESGMRAGVDATPLVQESLFREISEIEESEGDAPAEADVGSEAPSDDQSEATAEAGAEPVRPEPVPEPPVESPDEGTNRMILRALCHLLIEKGVIAREELQQLVQSIQQQEGD
jgi:hypothetical protein